MKQYELTELIDLMKRERVTKVKMGGLEVELAPSALATTEELDTKNRKPMPTPEDFVNWSVSDSEWADRDLKS